MTKVKVTSREIFDGDDHWWTEHLHEVVDAPSLTTSLSSLGRDGKRVMRPVPENDRAKVLELLKKKSLAPRLWDAIAAIRGEHAARLRVWRRVEKGIRQPSKRQTTLAGEMTSLMDAAATFISSLESLSPEAVGLLAPDQSPTDRHLFVIARNHSESFSTVSLAGLLYAAREAALLVEDRAKCASGVKKEALPTRTQIRQQILQKPATLEHLSGIWVHQGRRAKGSREFLVFADCVMRDIDPEFSSEYEWKRDPHGDQWVLREFILRRPPASGE